METIGVIGIGKLGLCFALNVESAGWQVIGVDRDQRYVDLINQKGLRTAEPSVNDMLQAAQKFTASTSVVDLLKSDAKLFFIMVATPALPDGTYDHSQLERVVSELITFGKTSATRHLVIGCTTMPGYCNDLSKRLEAFNYTVSYNPEFIAQGSVIRDQQYADQVLIGEANSEAGDKIEKVHRSFLKSEPVVCRMDPLSAEIAKLATNCFLTTKIAFANSLGDLAKKAGANPEKILSAVGADSRIGGKYLKYGDGYGGPCLPRDNRALMAFSEKLNIPLPISKATDTANDNHLIFQFDQFMAQGHRKILISGLAYKEGTVFIDESQRLRLAVMLAKAGVSVEVADRAEVIEKVRDLYGDLFLYKIS